MGKASDFFKNAGKEITAGLISTAVRKISKGSYGNSDNRGGNNQNKK